MNLHTNFIRCAFRCCGQTEAADQFLIPINAKNRIGIANVNGQ